MADERDDAHIYFVCPQIKILATKKDKKQQATQSSVAEARIMAALALAVINDPVSAWTEARKAVQDATDSVRESVAETLGNLAESGRAAVQ